MGRPNNTKTPPKYSPYKRRTPLGIIQRKISVMVSSAVAFSGGLRRSFSKALLSNTESPNFQTLPLELLFHLFDLTSSEDLVSICTVNRANMDNVATYLNSEQFTKRLKRELASTLTADANAQSICSPAAFAQLIRTCHLFQSKENREATNEQLCADFVVKMYNKIGSLKSELYNDYWGALISTLTWDWAQLTFYSFMHNFTDATGIRARVDWFMYTNTPHDKVEELALRRLLRALFLDNIDPQGAANLTGDQGAQEVAFRLSAILRMFASDETLTHRLMLLLGAPISVSDGVGNNNGGGAAAAAANNNNNRNRLATGQEFVDYHRVIADPVHDRQSAIDILGSLPYFTGQLLRTSTIAVPQLRWSELEVFNFLEMLTTYPEPWVLRNFASLLVMAPELARVAIYIRALHGDPAEAGNTMFSCIEASLLLDIKPQAIFRDTLNALTSKCSAAACLTVLREAGSTAHNLTLEAIGTDQQNNNNGNGNGNANHNAAAPVDVDEVDILNLKTALETQRQVADLFLAHLHQIDI